MARDCFCFLAEEVGCEINGSSVGATRSTAESAEAGGRRRRCRLGLLGRSPGGLLGGERDNELGWNLAGRAREKKKKGVGPKEGKSWAARGRNSPAEIFYF